MPKTRTLIGAYFGNNRKRNWIGSAETRAGIEQVIIAHMGATGRKRKEYKTFTYKDDPEKLSAPD